VQNDRCTSTQRTYLGAYALALDAHDRLLLCRLSAACIEAGHWTLPGGGVDWGESPERTVVRELQEETGLTASRMELARHVFSEVYPNTGEELGDPVHHVGLLYRVQEPIGVLRPEVAGTTDHCGWFSEVEVLQLPLTALARFALSIAWDKGEDDALRVESSRSVIPRTNQGTECPYVEP